MKIKPKYIQKDCVEGDEVDLRQANTILKYKSDIVVFELPAGKSGPDSVFNKYSVNKKPLKKVDEIIKRLKISAKKYPYAGSDVVVWENIKKLWADGHNVLIYNIDAPDELRSGYIKNLNFPYPQARKNWLFWVYLYIRDTYMARNMEKVLKNYELINNKGKENPTIAIFLQSIHWKHVQFLLTKPTQAEIFKYYFGRFSELNTKNIGNEIKAKNKFLYKWWSEVTN